MKVFLTLALILCALPVSGAATASAPDDLTARFDAANKAYEQGHYEAAAAAYRSLLEAGASSAALHFNLATALHQSGRKGLAIAHYRIARRLAPRDAAVVNNLNFVRAPAGTSPLPFSKSRTGLSLDEAATLAAVAWWIWMSLLIVRQWGWGGGRGWSFAIRGAAVAWAVFAAGAGWLWYELEGSRPAVVVAEEAVARLGPFDESASAFILPDGAEVNVQKMKEEWFQIRTPDGRRGWVKKEILFPLWSGSRT